MFSLLADGDTQKCSRWCGGSCSQWDSEKGVFKLLLLVRKFQFTCSITVLQYYDLLGFNRSFEKLLGNCVWGKCIKVRQYQLIWPLTLLTRLQGSHSLINENPYPIRELDSYKCSDKLFITRPHNTSSINRGVLITDPPSFGLFGESSGIPSKSRGNPPPLGPVKVSWCISGVDLDYETYGRIKSLLAGPEYPPYAYKHIPWAYPTSVIVH